MPHKAIPVIREFNRFYTAILGVVNNHIPESAYSLTEARIIYEVANSETTTAAEIKEILQVDEGYLSRILTQFVKKGILDKNRSKTDKRVYLLTLTAKGRGIADDINRQSDTQIANLIQHLTKAEQEELVTLVSQVKNLLTPK